MSGQSTSGSLTKKFSRVSLRKAMGQGETAKVHSREEELARATNKRFNSDSWRKVSRSYRALPNAPTSESRNTSNSHSINNTQILCALSSLTEDQAFRTGSSHIPVRTASSFAASSYSTARESPLLTRTKASSPPALQERSLPKAKRMHTSPLQNAGLTAIIPKEQPTVSPPSAPSAPTTYPSKHQPAKPNSLPKPKSLRSAAGHRPALSRKLGHRRLPATSVTRKMGQDKLKSTARFQRQVRVSGKASGGQLSLQSFFSLFTKIFKLFHHILMLPDTIRRFLTKPRWSGKGKTILITGASSGIGAEMARQYAAQGAKLALFARTSEDLDRVASECRELGSMKANYYSCDLSSTTSIKLAMTQALKDFGKFEVVILNAGKSQGCFFEEIKDASQIENMIKLNVNGAITSLHYVLPQIPKTRDSRIVVISNTAGIVASPYQSIYSATKHALTGFSNSLRIELKNTYGKDSPRVCLVSFPEVSGTKCNTGRMDMGAKLPPAKWYSWAGIPVSHAVHELLPAIAAGKREFGQPSRFDFWRSLYTFCPEWVDFWMMKHIQKTHYRPLDERQHSSNKKKTETMKAPHNRSWAC